MTKRKYITPKVEVILIEKETDLLAGSLTDADSSNAATDVNQDVMNGPEGTKLPVSNSGGITENDFAKDWFYDDNFEFEF